MRLHPCRCPAILPDGSTDFGPRIVGERGVWDLPCVSYAPDDTPLPLYQHGKQLDYRANKLSMRCGCLAKNWEKFKNTLPDLPYMTVFVPKNTDYHFINNMLQYRPEKRSYFRYHLRAGPLLDHWSQLPTPADINYRYRAPFERFCLKPPRPWGLELVGDTRAVVSTPSRRDA